LALIGAKRRPKTLPKLKKLSTEQARGTRPTRANAAAMLSRAAEGFIDSTTAKASKPLPSGYVKIAIENGPFIVDLPIKNGDFP